MFYFTALWTAFMFIIVINEVCIQCKAATSRGLLEPALLECESGTVLRVIGLTPVDGPQAAETLRSASCDRLAQLQGELARQCDGLRKCIIDMSLVHNTKLECPHISYLSIDVFCEPADHSGPRSKPRTSNPKASGTKMHQSRGKNQKQFEKQHKKQQSPMATKHHKNKSTKYQKQFKKQGQKQQPPKAKHRSAGWARVPGAKSLLASNADSTLGSPKLPLKRKPKPEQNRQRVGQQRVGRFRKTRPDILANMGSKQVKCKEVRLGNSQNFICHHNGPLPNKILRAVRDDSYIVVTGSKARKDGLVIIQRDGRPLSKKLLLNILRSNDEIRDALPGARKSVAAPPKSFGKISSETLTGVQAEMAAVKGDIPAAQDALETAVNLSRMEECVDKDFCKNGGTCQVSVNQQVCICRSGFVGQRCETSIDQCQTNPCQNGGSCIPDADGGGLSCNCLDGFTGQHCELQVNVCNSKPCYGKSHCIPDNTNPEKFRCICKTGYSGNRCDVFQGKKQGRKPPNEACTIDGPKRCLNGGTCRRKAGGRSRCHCPLGYLGNLCGIRATQCDTTPCMNGATCMQAVSYFRCLCPRSFTGRLCEKLRHAGISCASKPCSAVDPAATCIGLPGGGYRCSCSSHTTGDRCQVQGDPCGVNSGSSPCGNAGICLPVSPASNTSSYQCLCDRLHIGQQCEIPIVRCGNTICLNGGKCDQKRNSPKPCRCPPGFVGRRCEHRAMPCRSQPCLNGGLCKPSANREGFMCVCQPPFSGKRCSILPPGVTPLPSPSDTLLVDEKGRGECPPELNDCQNGASCFRTKAGGRVCVCPRSYGGDRCENSQDACSSSPCLNEASCYNAGSGAFRCVCMTGFSGIRCEQAVALCSPNPCLNNGACRQSQTTAGFVCVCPRGFGGITCELRDPCLDLACRNGAECVVLPSTSGSSSSSSSFRCQCPAGFSGEFCSINETSSLALSQQTACTAVPCHNGATCRLAPNTRRGFVCVCPPGVKGRLCESDARDDCRGKPCQNGGVCFDKPGGFECSCPEGTKGITCEIKLFKDPCDNQPCLNGGKCKMVNGYEYKCTCPALFAGSKCQTTKSICTSEGVCPANLVCKEDPADFNTGFMCVDESLQSEKWNYDWKFVEGNETASNVTATGLIAESRWLHGGVIALLVLLITCGSLASIIATFLCCERFFRSPLHRHNYRQVPTNEPRVSSNNSSSAGQWSNNASVDSRGPPLSKSSRHSPRHFPLETVPEELADFFVLDDLGNYNANNSLSVARASELDNVNNSAQAQSCSTTAAGRDATLSRMYEFAYSAPHLWKTSDADLKNLKPAITTLPWTPNIVNSDGFETVDLFTVGDDEEKEPCSSRPAVGVGPFNYIAGIH